MQILFDTFSKFTSITVLVTDITPWKIVNGKIIQYEMNVGDVCGNGESLEMEALELKKTLSLQTFLATQMFNSSIGKTGKN